MWKFQPDGLLGLVLEWYARFSGGESLATFLSCWREQAGAVGPVAGQQMSHKRLLTKVSLILSRAIAAIGAMAVCSLGAAAAPSARPSACGTVPYPTSYKTPNPITQSPQVWSFVSEPKLHPMKIMVNTYQPGTSSGLIFVAPYTYSDNALYGQPGSFILDNIGNPFWFRPLSSPNLMNTDFRMQQLNGKPVLTFWQGTLATPPAYTNVPAGSSQSGSCYYIIDNTYQVIKTVTAQFGVGCP
jgi:hypothetical protein